MLQAPPTAVFNIHWQYFEQQGLNLLAGGYLRTMGARFFISKEAVM